MWDSGTQTSFVVRIWLEDGERDTPRWRGHIQHIQSATATYFSSLNGMAEFVTRVSGHRLPRPFEAGSSDNEAHTPDGRAEPPASGGPRMSSS